MIKREARFLEQKKLVILDLQPNMIRVNVLNKQELAVLMSFSLNLSFDDDNSQIS
jgi:hypothetical protein